MTDLFTPDQFKSHLGISGTADNTFIAYLVTVVNDFAARYYGRTSFNSTAYVEKYDGLGKDFILVKNTPISAMTEINVDPDHVFGASTVVDASKYVWSPGSGKIQLINQADNILVTGGIFPVGGWMTSDGRLPAASVPKSNQNSS